MIVRKLQRLGNNLRESLLSLSPDDSAAIQSAVPLDGSVGLVVQVSESPSLPPVNFCSCHVFHSLLHCYFLSSFPNRSHALSPADSTRTSPPLWSSGTVCSATAASLPINGSRSRPTRRAGSCGAPIGGGCRPLTSSACGASPLTTSPSTLV